MEKPFWLRYREGIIDNPDGKDDTVTAYTYLKTFAELGGYDQYRELHGEPFTTMRVIDQPDETHDACVLPMFEIAIAGLVIEAWPEEVLDRASWEDAHGTSGEE